MPVPTPLHPRTSALCTSLLWKEWAGCHAVRRFDTTHEREVHAIRHGAGLMDATPLYKVELEGPDAARLLSRVTVRGHEDQKIGTVRYVCWTDDRGKVLDDGTVARLAEERWRMTSAEPNLRWLERHARGLSVELRDVSRSLAALALQGPRSRAILAEVLGPEVEGLRFFRAMRAELAGGPVEVTRTGYTGDLGYEVWVPAERACAAWDAILEAGRPHGCLPNGLDALDVVRVEAGFLLMGVDYFSARHAVIPSQESTPLELGFGWMVRLERAPFVGREALAREAERGPARVLVGLAFDGAALDELHERRGLPPSLPTETSREGVPVLARGRQVGQATSRAWSPVLKRYFALATVEARFAEIGTELEVETTVEYARERCPARVAAKPFFDPERKRA